MKKSALSTTYDEYNYYFEVPSPTDVFLYISKQIVSSKKFKNFIFQKANHNVKSFK